SSRPSSFFSAPAQLRRLPSFPTRRSSDLACGTQQFQQCVDQMLGPCRGVADAGDVRLVGLADLGRLVQPRGKPGDAAQWRTQVVDRKSTRLNSSHVKISYAVFCLKKKKKQ